MSQFSYEYLCEADQVPQDCGLRVQPAGCPAIAVFRIGNEYHGLDDLCTHGEASLAEGYVEEGTVECPWHAGRFDIRTGAPLSSPCIVAARTHALEQRGSAVFRIFPVREQIGPEQGPQLRNEE